MSDPGGPKITTDQGPAGVDAAVGCACALGAFGLWGFMPVYFKAVEDVPPLEILAHRVVWSVLLVGIGLFVLGK